MKKKLFGLLSMLFFSAAAHAGEFSGCTVGTIVVIGAQNVHVSLNCTGSFANYPACAAAINYVGFDGTSQAGKYYFSLMSMALALNLKLEGTVDLSCSPYQGNVALLTGLRATK